MMERRLAERRPMELFTLNIKTGERKTLHKSHRLAQSHSVLTNGSQPVDVLS